MRIEHGHKGRVIYQQHGPRDFCINRTLIKKRLLVEFSCEFPTRYLPLRDLLLVMLLVFMTSGCHNIMLLLSCLEIIKSEKCLWLFAIVMKSDKLIQPSLSTLFMVFSLTMQQPLIYFQNGICSLYIILSPIMSILLQVDITMFLQQTLYLSLSQ